MAGCRRAAAVAVALSFTFVQAALGQTLTVGDPLEDYLRVLQISGEAEAGSFMVRPWISGDGGSILADDRGPWALRQRESDALTIVPPELRSYANSRFPVGRNDGAVWQGRGFTTAIEGGAALRWRGVTVEVRPTLLYAQNASFELAPVTVPTSSPYAYPWWIIDWPQRFGPDPLWRLDPGQSEIRFETRGLVAGFGSKNLWWGPAIENSIIMSNNAPGFPHAFLGSGRPLRIGIGELEFRWIWGRLQQSGWFDPMFDPPVTGESRFITGIAATYAPSFLPGLSVGLTRVFYSMAGDGVPVSDYFAVFQAVRKKSLVTPENPDGQDEHDQLLSLFGRWVLPESGFEVYGEWARTDHAWELRDFLLEPEYSQAYTLGLQKAIPMDSGSRLTLRGELTHLAMNTTAYLRQSNPIYYYHYPVSPGYTQRGQIIGAGIGPGGNAQSVAADLYTSWGRVGTWLERQVHDNDAYYAIATDPNSTLSTPYCCHDVSFHWGTQALWFKGRFDLGAGMIITREFNRYFYGLDLWNLNVSLSAKWHPR